MKKQGHITIGGKDFVAYKNDEGFIELYRTVGKVTIDQGGQKSGDKVERVVTRYKEFSDVYKNMFKKKKRRKPYDPYKDKNQLLIT